MTFLTLPIVAIFVNTGPGALVSSLGEEGAREALLLSLETTALALALIVVVGTPAAYLLATRAFRGRALVITLIELPLVLPPAVAGIALLAAVGPAGILGGTLEAFGVELALDDRGRGGGADVRRGAVLPAPGGRGVRGGRPHAARRLAHARRAARRARSRG